MVFRNWDKELTEENLREHITKAKEAWKNAEATEPRAESGYYNHRTYARTLYIAYPLPRLTRAIPDATP
ncbi:DUF2442 domain-containing protein, partial [Microcoleus sp. MON1_C5]